MSAPEAPILVMGVAGCGKTTFGARLADLLNRPFFDADDLHSPEARAKMAAGEPLTDADRAPWLARLNAALLEAPRLVLACSALKQAYRDRLGAGLSAPLTVICLAADKAVIAARLQARDGHFFPPSLMDSQFAALELPRHGLILDAAAPLDTQLARALEALNLKQETAGEPPPA